jgi:hypothetical protein
VGIINEKKRCPEQKEEGLPFAFSWLRSIKIGSNYNKDTVVSCNYMFLNK